MFFFVAVLHDMEFTVRDNNSGKFYMFLEEAAYKKAIQPKFAVVGGGITFRLPRVQDAANTYSDIDKDEPGSIRWYSRTGSQIDQAEMVLDMVAHDLLKENIC